MSDPRERRIAIMRRVIERGGHCTSGGRYYLLSSVGCPVTLASIVSLVWGCAMAISYRDVALLGHSCLAGFAGPLLAIVAVRTMAVIYRAYYARRVRHRLACLSPEDQAAVLLPLIQRPVNDDRSLQPVIRHILEHWDSDTRKIAASLAKGRPCHSGPGWELSPADFPRGCGNEPAAAEDQR